PQAMRRARRLRSVPLENETRRAPSELHAALLGVAVARARYCAGREEAVEGGQRLRRRRQGGGVEVLFEPARLPRPWNGHDEWATREPPREGELRRARAFASGERSQPVDQRAIALDVL